MIFKRDYIVYSYGGSWRDVPTNLTQIHYGVTFCDFSSRKNLVSCMSFLGDSAKAVFLENEESRCILFTYMAIESH